MSATVSLQAALTRPGGENSDNTTLGAFASGKFGRRLPHVCRAPSERLQVDIVEPLLAASGKARAIELQRYESLSCLSGRHTVWTRLNAAPSLVLRDRQGLLEHEQTQGLRCVRTPMRSGERGWMSGRKLPHSMDGLA